MAPFCSVGVVLHPADVAEVAPASVDPASAAPALADGAPLDDEPPVDDAAPEAAEEPVDEEAVPEDDEPLEEIAAPDDEADGAWPDEDEPPKAPAEDPAGPEAPLLTPEEGVTPALPPLGLEAVAEPAGTPCAPFDPPELEPLPHPALSAAMPTATMMLEPVIRMPQSFAAMMISSALAATVAPPPGIRLPNERSPSRTEPAPPAAEKCGLAVSARAPAAFTDKPPSGPPSSA